MSDAVPFADLGALYREDAPAYDAAYQRVMDSGRWILGAELTAFEAEWAAACGRRHAIGVGNGLDALVLALRALGVGAGDEVLVPAHTFIATWLAVAQVGAVPRAVEPAPGRMVIGLPQVQAAATPRTRAVLPVHLYGEPADPQGIAAWCAQQGIACLFDAAQAQGAQHGGRDASAWGDAASHSFYPGKNLGAFGDAGAVVCDDDALATRLRQLRNYGGERKYEHAVAGVNSRLDELQAAFLRVRLARLAQHNAARRAQAAQYSALLAGTPGLTLPSADVPASCWHLYVVQTAQRDTLARRLAEQGIATLVHYPKPAYRCAPFAAHGPAARSETDRLCDEVLSLPIGPHLSADQVARVASAVSAVSAALA